MKKQRFPSHLRTKVRRHGPPGSARAQPCLPFNMLQQLKSLPFQKPEKKYPFQGGASPYWPFKGVPPPLGGLGWLWLLLRVTKTKHCLIAHLMGVCLRKHSLSRFHSIMMHTLMLSNEIVPLLQTVHPSSMFHLSGR